MSPRKEPERVALYVVQTQSRDEKSWYTHREIYATRQEAMLTHAFDVNVLQRPRARIVRIEGTVVDE